MLPPPNPQEPVNGNTFHFSLDRERLRRTLRREGRYRLRSNMQAASPKTVWESYLLLTRIEQTFKDLKGRFPSAPSGNNWNGEWKPMFWSPFWLFVSTPCCEILCVGEPQG
ncbi:MAG: hypothetical protein IPI25_14215 [Candidatus Brocadia sp.]|nr:MAG: hypothetical protein IPI25_14215 [Candidatus Brocadia sp.]